MRIGIPKEIKPFEGRVALVPDAAAELTAHGHRVVIQAGAGKASGYDDEEYRRAGVEVLTDAAAVYANAELIVKVKEPVADEYALLRPEHVLFSYLHLAALPELAAVLKTKRLTAVAFETVEVGGRRPLLAPMSAIAGRIAVQFGATLLYGPQGGRGVLLGGVPGTTRGRVVVLGAGEAGGHAVSLAAALGAEVTVFDRSPDALARMHALGPNVTALSPTDTAIALAAEDADLLIGAVLVPGGRAPYLVSAATVSRMRPGAVVVDISVDQGGCIATTRPTDYRNPTYVVDGVVHFTVTNMPGAVPRTASQALSAVLTPYVLRLAAGGLDAGDPALTAGVNVRGGRITHPAVVEALGA
jgi:alanine dehydrogenase